MREGEGEKEREGETERKAEMIGWRRKKKKGELVLGKFQSAQLHFICF